MRAQLALHHVVLAAREDVFAALDSVITRR
jgi:hypothetical protein